MESDRFGGHQARLFRACRVGQLALFLIGPLIRAVSGEQFRLCFVEHRICDFIYVSQRFLYESLQLHFAFVRQAAVNHKSGTLVSMDFAC